MPTIISKINNIIKVYLRIKLLSIKKIIDECNNPIATIIIPKIIKFRALRILFNFLNSKFLLYSIIYHPPKQLFPVLYAAPA